MKTHTIETIIKGLRIRSKSNPQDRLEDILSAHDQWQQRLHPPLQASESQMGSGTGFGCDHNSRHHSDGDT